jgi:hypothetical protein
MRLKVAFLYVFLAASTFAQSAGGLAGISGVVRDPSGSLVPNAKVVVSNDNNGTARSLTTNDSGLFSAPALTPASGCKVTVATPGFAGYEARDLVLQVDQNLDLNVKLTVAQAATAVEVVATALTQARRMQIGLRLTF